jgi:hypothetical protein
MSVAEDMDLSLLAEYEDASLGDARRSARLHSMVEAIAECPDASMPDIFTGSAELEGSYRFLRNEEVTHQAVLAPHVERTAARARDCELVVAAHDTTEFNFGKYPRKDLGQVGLGKSYGFFGHFTLAVAGGSNLPLGVCALASHRRDGKKHKKGKKPKHSQRHNDPHNEGLRWFRGVEATEQALSGCQKLIHVMDREADDYALFAAMSRNEYDFVIRSSHDRRTISKELKISDVLEQAPLFEGPREIILGKRAKNLRPKSRKRHPPRKRRPARLAVRAVRVVLPRPDSAPRHCPKTLELSLVQVLEPNPPNGEEPVVWNLWTTEPCETEEQVWAVVDAYRARWVIEEYFKALKTGCAYESRQFETEAALLRLLAIFIPIAWWLLMLRTLERIDPKRPARALLSPLQMKCLRGALRKSRVDLPTNPTVRELLGGLARLGGHIPYNGAPGWIVLLRGLEKLTLLVEGMRLAQDEM